MLAMDMHEDDRSHDKRDDPNAQAAASAYHPALSPSLAIAWSNGSRSRIRPASAASSSSNDTSAMRERDEKNFVRQFDLER